MYRDLQIQSLKAKEIINNQRRTNKKRFYLATKNKQNNLHDYLVICTLQLRASLLASAIGASFNLFGENEEQKEVRDREREVGMDLLRRPFKAVWGLIFVNFFY